MVTQVTTANFSNATLTALTSPTITSITVTNSSFVPTGATAVELTGGYVTVVGSSFVSGATVYIDSTPATAVTFVNSTQLNVQVPGLASNSYIVYVINLDGSVAIRVNGINYSANPTWVTSGTQAYSSGTISLQLVASSDSTIIYTVASGSSLPSGLTLTTSGLLSGVVTGSGIITYNFSVAATDVETQRSTQAFSITITYSDPYWNSVTLLLNGETPVTSFITDASTNNFNSTIAGDTRPTLVTPYQNGYYSNYFDGSGDYLGLPANVNLTLNGDFTIEFWINLTALTASQTVFNNSNGNDRSVQLDGTGANWVYWDGTANRTIGTPALNTWTHIALTRQTSTVKGFLNGVQGFSVSDSGTIDFSSGAVGYRQRTTAGASINGYISNLRIVKGTAVYTANFTPPTSPLTAISGTSLLTCQSNRLIDNSLNNVVITKNGDTTVSGFTPFTPPTSVTVNNLYSTYFDGTGDYVSTPSNIVFAFGTGDYTMECWAYPQPAGKISRLIQYSDNVDGVEINSSVGVYTLGYISYFNGISSASSSTAIVQNNAWNHIAIVRASGTVKVYVGGVLAITQGTTSNTVTARSLAIGGTSVDATFSLFYGNVSNFRVVKGIAVYTTAFTPGTTQLTSTQSANVNGSPSAAITGTATSLLTCQNSTIIDNSTYVLTLTSNGDARPIALSPFTQTTTTVALTTLGSTYFDGTGDSLTLPASAAFAPGTGAFTVEGWYYSTAASGNQQMWAQTVGGSDYFVVMFTPATSQFRFIGNGVDAFSTAIAKANTWNHFAVVRVGTSVTVYCNGVGGTPVTFADNFSNTTYVPTISGYTHSATNMLTGYLSNLRYVKGTAVYTSNFAPPVQSLTAVTNTSLLTLQYNGGANNSGIIDNSSLNNVITRFGNTSQGTFSPYGSNWSNYFPATGNYLYATNSIYNIGSASAVWTVEMWIYPLTVTGWNALAIGSGGSYGNSLLVGFSSNRFYLGQSIGGGSGGPSITSANTYTANAWYHIAGTRTSAGVIVLYVNGVAAGTQTYVTGVAGGTTFVVNGVYDNNGLGNSGGQFYTQDVRLIIGTALGTGSTYPVPTAPLTAINGTVLLTCQSAGFVDNGPLAVAISFGGSPVAQRFSSFAQVIQTPLSYSGYFDGTGDYLSTPSSVSTSSGWNLMSPSATGTFEAWVYRTFSDVPAGYSGRVIVSCIYFSASYTGWYIQMTAAGIISVDGYISGNNSVPPAITSTGSVAINTWAHVAVTCVNGAITFYINGVNSGTGTMGATWQVSTSTATPTYVGTAYTGWTNLFIGSISNVRMVKGVAVYTGAFTVPTTPLTATQSSGTNIAAITGTSTSLLTCQSTTFIDNSTNNFTITAFGDVKARTFNPFGVTNNTNQAYTPALYGGSAYFDGTGDYLSNGPYTGQSNFTPSYSTAQNKSATIEFWVYPTTTGVCRPYSYCTSSVGTGNDVGMYCYLFGSGSSYQVQFGWYNQGTTYVVTGGGALPYAWTHIAFTYNPNGGVGTLYVNGVSVGTPVSGGNVNGGAPNSITNAYNYIGVYSPGSSPSYLTGYMSDFRYILGSIVYTGNFVPPQAPLTATTNNTTMLLNFTSGGVIDYHTNNVLETAGNAQLSTGLKQFGNASMYFDGTGDYLLSPSTQFQNYNFGTGDFTIECWLYQTAFSGDKTIIASVTTWATSVNFYFATRAGTPNILLFRGGDNIPITLNGNTGITASTWTHVAVTRASGVTRMFVDGVVQTATHTGSVNVGATVRSTWVGAWGSAINEPMTGYIDELRVTKGIARYTATFSVPTAPFQTI